MRLFALLALLLILQLALTNNVYDAEQCGKPLINSRKRRSLKDSSENTEADVIGGDDSEKRSSTDGDDSGDDNDDDVGDEEKEDEKMTQKRRADKNWIFINVANNSKVMGGTTTRLEEYPWVVRLEIRKENNMISTCGGTLITKRHVITAAHCYQGDNVDSHNCSPDMHSEKYAAERTIVHVNSICSDTYDPRNPCPGKDGGEKRNVTRAFIHEEYNKENCSTGSFDMALLELDKEVDIPHACLPHLHNMDTYKMYKGPLWMAGFGLNPNVDPTGTSKTLQTLNLGSPLSRETCHRRTGAKHPDLFCIEETIGKQACGGDSGSGLMTQMNQRAFIVGVLSRATSCTNPNSPPHLFATDIDIFSATIDKFIGTKSPDLRSVWKNL